MNQSLLNYVLAKFYSQKDLKSVRPVTVRAVVAFSLSLQAHVLSDLKVSSLGPFALATAGFWKQHISSSQLNSIPANLSSGR